MTISTSKTDATPMATDHPGHHNALAAAVNALQAISPVKVGDAASGSLTGTYPGPTIALGAVTTPMLAVGAATGVALGNDVLITSKANQPLGYVQPDSGGLIPTNKLGTGTSDSTVFLRGDRVWAVPGGGGSGGPPSGPAGGSLAGTYPNPVIATGAVTATMLAGAAATGSALGTDVITTSTNAGGDLTGTFPTLTIGTSKVITTSLAAGAVTAAKIAANTITSGQVDTSIEITSHKNAINGYAGLNASALVAPAQLGTGTADSTKFLRGDETWSKPPTQTYAATAVNSAGIATGTYFVVRIPSDRAGTAVKMQARAVGATGSVNYNFRKNGSLLLHAADITAAVNAWTTTNTSLQNNTFVADDYVEVMITSITGTITQFIAQLEIQ